MTEESLIIQNYKWLHRHPELALSEFETTDYIKSQLAVAEGVELLNLGLETGVLARIAGNEGGPTIAVRADIDALPITEKSGLPYSSEKEGRMHACGHDFHTAVLLQTARLLADAGHKFSGTVILLFQPAEEAEHGAARVVKREIFQTYNIDRIFALHVTPELPVGSIRIGPGPFSANVDRFYYRIKGCGGHGSAPQNTKDPIPAAAALVGRLQQIVSRCIDPMKPAVVSVTRLQGGTSWNIIPEFAELEGTARSFHRDVREKIQQELFRASEAVRAEGYEVEYQFIPGCPAANNDAALADRISKIAAESGFQVFAEGLSMGGEDFSCFQELVPGALFHIGTGLGPSVHHPGFTVDLSALEPAADLMKNIVLDSLKIEEE